MSSVTSKIASCPMSWAATVELFLRFLRHKDHAVEQTTGSPPHSSAVDTAVA